MLKQHTHESAEFRRVFGGRHLVPGQRQQSGATDAQVSLISAPWTRPGIDDLRVIGAGLQWLSRIDFAIQYEAVAKIDHQVALESAQRPGLGFRI